MSRQQVWSIEAPGVSQPEWLAVAPGVTVNRDFNVFTCLQAQSGVKFLPPPRRVYFSPQAGLQPRCFSAKSKV